MVNAGVHACARFSMQVVNVLERSVVVALASDGPAFEDELENLLMQVPPMPMVEGPSTILKNSTGMGPTPQAVMFPPTHHPISIEFVAEIVFIHLISLEQLMYPGLGPACKRQ